MYELKQHDLGKFQLTVDAVRAYDKRPTDLKGEKCGINFKNDVMHETAKAKEIAEQDEGVKLVEVNKAKNDVNDKRKTIKNASKLMEEVSVVKGADHTRTSLNSLQIQLQLGLC